MRHFGGKCSYKVKRIWKVKRMGVGIEILLTQLKLDFNLRIN